MKLRLSLIVVILLACMYCPGVLANGSSTFVSDCDTMVESSYDGENIVVTNDIAMDRTGYCIFIDHDNVTVDCQGYRLTGIGDDQNNYGVRAEYAENTLIQNCEFYNWAIGVYFYYGDTNTAFHNKFRFNDSGIAFLYSDYGWVQDCKADDNVRSGVQVHTSDYFVVFDNSIHGSACAENSVGGAGILVNNSDFGFVVDNQTNANCENGIRLQNESDSNYVYDNTSNLNVEGRPGRVGIGIAIAAFSDGNEVTDNTANRNDVGISTNTTNTFDGNRCHKNNIADSSPATGVCK